MSAQVDVGVLSEALAGALGDVDFFAAFTFGEQGMINGRACHGNLMLNVALFG